MTGSIIAARGGIEPTKAGPVTELKVRHGGDGRGEHAWPLVPGTPLSGMPLSLVPRSAAASLADGRYESPRGGQTEVQGGQQSRARSKAELSRSKSGGKSTPRRRAGQRGMRLPGGGSGCQLGGQRWFTEPLRAPLYYPFSAVARLVGLSSHGRPFAATAWIIAPHTLVTAAHCVYDQNCGEAFRQICVQPGFHRDATAQPIYPVDRLALSSRYVDQADRGYDLALLFTREKLSDQYGYLGYDLSGPIAGQHAEMIGYPVQPRPLLNQSDSIIIDFDGQRPWRCVGQAGPVDRNLIGVACPMTDGSSGAPWLRAGTDVVVGVTTAGCQPHANDLFGPPLRKALLPLVKWLQQSRGMENVVR